MNRPEKLLPLDELVRRVADERAAGRRIVFTNGCFDLLHPGHVHLLRAAAAEGDVLVVAVNGDASIRALKGPLRPILDEAERLAMLDALQCVDYLVVFVAPTPIELIRTLRPDVLVKGADWRLSEVVGRAEVEGAGGRVVLVDPLRGASTTSLVRRIVTRFGSPQE